MPYLDQILETAEWLGKKEDLSLLLRMKQLKEEKQFNITVWGHYSAGKSRLINSILKRDILPVQSQETTAVLTYISYGDDEKCVVIYDDGMVSDKPIDYLKSVYQYSNNKDELRRIDHIEVYVKNQILQPGLTLVDTPGVNTLIKEHQDLAVDAIEQSGVIIYVLGNSPTNVDRQFIKMINDCGVTIYFVRTKCDRLNSTEEDAESSLKNEKNEIEEFVNHNIIYIPISNESESEWNKNIGRVINLLKDITLDLEMEMNRSIEKRLQHLASRYLVELNNREKEIYDALNGKLGDIKHQIVKYEHDLNTLKMMEKQTEEKLASKIEEAKRLSNQELNELIVQRSKSFSNELSQIDFHDTDLNSKTKKLFRKHSYASMENIQAILNNNFNRLVENEIKDFSSYIVDSEEKLPEMSYSDVVQDNARLLEAYKARLSAEKNKLEQNRAEQKEKMSNVEEFDDSAYEEALSKLSQSLSEIPSGTAYRLSEDQPIQPSSVFKAVGTAADIALLLLPGEAIVSMAKGLVDTTKLAQSMHKATGVFKVLKESIPAMDRARDIAYSVNQVLGKRAYSTAKEKELAKQFVGTVADKAGASFNTYKEAKKSGNVLDALSIAYWAEKFGSTFDSPPKLEVDVEVQHARDEARREITEQKTRISKERIAARERQGLFNSRISQLKFEEEEQQRVIREVEDEMKIAESEILEKSKKQLWESYYNGLIHYYSDAITELSQHISNHYFKSANQNLTMYVSVCNSKIQNQILEKKEQLNSLIEYQKNGTKDLEESLASCRKLYKALRDVQV